MLYFQRRLWDVISQAFLLCQSWRKQANARFYLAFFTSASQPRVVFTIQSWCKRANAKLVLAFSASAAQLRVVFTTQR
jgi:hypothetical protein